MSRIATSTSPKQMKMPGMPESRRGTPTVRCCTLVPGQQVYYLGKIQGGPRYGSAGVVMRVLSHKAVVEIQGSGTWNIPYFCQKEVGDVPGWMELARIPSAAC